MISFFFLSTFHVRARAISRIWPHQLDEHEMRIIAAVCVCVCLFIVLLFNSLFRKLLHCKSLLLLFYSYCCCSINFLIVDEAHWMLKECSCESVGRSVGRFCRLIDWTIFELNKWIQTMHMYRSLSHSFGGCNGRKNMISSLFGENYYWLLQLVSSWEKITATYSLVLPGHCCK